jgi:hypothetical protein
MVALQFELGVRVSNETQPLLNNLTEINLCDSCFWLAFIILHQAFSILLDVR